MFVQLSISETFKKIKTLKLGMKPLELGIKTSKFDIKNTPNWVWKLTKYVKLQIPLNKLLSDYHHVYINILKSADHGNYNILNSQIKFPFSFHIK